MPRWTVALAVVFAAPSLAAAAPVCVPDTLASYVSLGAGGCSVGSATFFDFSASTPGATDTPIPAGAVLVTPLAAGLGLDFGVAVAASAGTAHSVLIGYSLSGASTAAAALSMAGAAVTPDGVVVAVMEACLGDVFAGDHPSTPCPGSLMDPLIVFDVGDDADLLEQAAFAASSFFDVFTEITIDGGLQGAAALRGTVRNEFRDGGGGGGGGNVPEPAAMLLLGFVCARVARDARRRGVGA